jgi:hypothetical protein
MDTGAHQQPSNRKPSSRLLVDRSAAQSIDSTTIHAARRFIEVKISVDVQRMRR